MIILSGKIKDVGCEALYAPKMLKVALSLSAAYRKFT